MKKVDIVLEEINRELNWKEKAITKINPVIFKKVYKMGIRRGFNWNNFNSH